MTEIISNLMEANLLGVFNERDAQRRASAIESTYAPDVRWTDDEGTTVGREALEAKAIALQSEMHALVFTKTNAGSHRVNGGIGARATATPLAAATNSAMGRTPE
jgi:hypothetical protein